MLPTFTNIQFESNNKERMVRDGQQKWSVLALFLNRTCDSLDPENV